MTRTIGPDETTPEPSSRAGCADLTPRDCDVEALQGELHAGALTRRDLIRPGSGRHVRIPPCRSSKTRPAPQTLAQRLYAENLELRELLLAVAGELERMAAFEGDAENRRTLLARAMRIRWRVHYGPGGGEARMTYLLPQFKG